MQSALAHQQTANNITFEAEQDTTLLTGRSVNVRADSEIALQTEQGSLTVNVPEGSTIINAEGDIRIEGTGSGDITLYNQGGMIKLDSGGNVELIGSDVLTLNGQMITFDGDVTYEITSPKTASEPSANSAPSIARIADINDDATTEQDIAPQTIDLAYHYQDGEPVKNAPYTLKLADGTEIEGTLDDSGQATLDNMPTGQFSVQYGEDTREYAPVDNTKPNPLYGKITPAKAVAMVESGETSLLDEAGDLAAQAGDWLWGTLQGDFNANPSTSQIVVGSIISMIPVVDQVMDCRDVCANIMVLTDEEESNDNNGWIALTLTAVGLVPIIGSAVKGVFKVVLANASKSLDVALAVLRKLGKGDPEKFIRDLDWNKLTKDATKAAKEKVTVIKDALKAVTGSWAARLVLDSATLKSIQDNIAKLNAFEQKIDQGIANAMQTIKGKVNKALDKSAEPLPHRGNTGYPQKAKTEEGYAPGAAPVGFHNQQWDKIDVNDFKTHRQIDMNNLSQSDLIVMDTLDEQGRSDFVEEILSSGKDFSITQIQKGDELYGFTSSGFPKAKESAYWMDKKSYMDVEVRFYKNGQWDKEGIKNYLALPCYNTADTFEKIEVLEEHTLVKSTIGEASELIGYTRGDFSTGLTSKTMSGGGIQVSPDASKLGEVIRLPKGKL
ncbi:hypothetical protein DXX93_08555 [Thalassotalea euphylliae]|uniref:DUF2345 domain-containing protein n=2 Tax=Thalassotalea euphylliae TaxID=1655234 RepID=A0A3E0TPR9_9GAMM|nr:hypothetical protein DXX93_08555 [Thalassotalea euphylliae]